MKKKKLKKIIVALMTLMSLTPVATILTTMPVHAATFKVVKTDKHHWYIGEKNKNNYVLYQGSHRMILPQIKGYSLHIIRTVRGQLAFGYSKHGQIKYIFNYNYRMGHYCFNIQQDEDGELVHVKTFASVDYQKLLGQMVKMVKS